MMVTFGLTKEFCNTQFAPVAALSAYYQAHQVLKPLESVNMAMKRIDFSPTDKLVQVFLSILTGCEYLSVVNTRLRPECKLAQVWGNESFAHQATLSETLEALTLTNLSQLEMAIGQSGFLAALYAAEFPDHVEALILVSPADVLVMPQPSSGLFELVTRRLPSDRQAEFEAYLQEYLDFSDIFTKSETDLVALNQEFGQYYLAAIDTALPKLGQPGGWMVQAMYFSMGQRHDYREALKAVTAPVLVIYGAEDLQPEETTRLYVEALPTARFQVIEGAGHFSFLEQPDVFAQTVSQFLANLN